MQDHVRQFSGDLPYLNETHFAINRPPPQYNHSSAANQTAADQQSQQPGGISMAIKTKLTGLNNNNNNQQKSEVIGLGIQSGDQAQKLQSQQKEDDKQQILNQPLGPQQRRTPTARNYNQQQQQQLNQSRLAIRRISSSTGSRSLQVNTAATSAVHSDPSTSNQFANNGAFVTGAQYSSMPPSPAVSYLTHIAECTRSLPRPPRVVDWQDSQVSQYKILQKIGTGNFADVYSGRILDGRSVAIKIVSKQRVQFMQGGRLSLPDVATFGPSSMPTTFAPCGNNRLQQQHSSLLHEQSSDGDELCGEREIDNDMREDELLYKELSIWKSLQHPNIVPLQDIIEYENQYLLLVMEQCEYGSLLSYINTHPSGLEEPAACYLFQQVCMAVQYLHRNGIVHRDLKAENVLLTCDASNRLMAKLCDFSLSDYYTARQSPASTPSTASSSFSTTAGADVPFAMSMTSMFAQRQDSCRCPNINEILSAGGVGSIDYAAPEELDHRLLHPPSAEESQHPFTYPAPTSDIWSLGVMLYAILCNTLPFHDDYRPRMQMYIMAASYKRLQPVSLSVNGGGGSHNGSGYFSNDSNSRNTSASNSFSGNNAAQSPLLASRSVPLQNGRTYSREVIDLIECMLTVDVYARLDIDGVLSAAWLAQLLDQPQQQELSSSQKI